MRDFRFISACTLLEVRAVLEARYCYTCRTFRGLTVCSSISLFVGYNGECCNKRSKNFDKRPNRRQKILRRSQDRGKAIDNGLTEMYQVLYLRQVPKPQVQVQVQVQVICFHCKYISGMQLPMWERIDLFVIEPIMYYSYAGKIQPSQQIYVVLNLLFYETLKLSVLIIAKCSQLFIRQQNVNFLHNKYCSCCQCLFTNSETRHS